MAPLKNLPKKIDKMLSEYPSFEELEEQEEAASVWEEKHDSEQERADIAVDEVETLKKEIEMLENDHASEIADLEEQLANTEKRLRDLISIAEL